MSTYVKDWKEKCVDDKKCKAVKDRLTKPIVLSCGTGNSIDFQALGADDEPVTPDPSSVIVASITVDTDGILKPTIEIEFSSVVNLIASFDDARGALNFRLTRVCENETPVIVNTWTYEVLEIEDVNTIRLSNSFSFIYCESLNKPGCCSYVVEASVGELINIDTLSVRNVHIAAIAQ